MSDVRDLPHTLDDGDGTGPATPALRRLTWRDALSSVLGLVLVVVLIAFGLPHFLGTSWAEIGTQLARVRPGTALAMAGLLLGGLLCYTWVLIGSLPGLRHLQALKANAVSSLVANVLPLGGALGLALTFLMFRTWDFRKREISSSLLVTGLWNVLARIALPVIGCLVFVAGPVDAPQVVVRGAWVAGLVGAALIVVSSVMIFSDRVAAGVSRVLHAVLAPFSATVRQGRGIDHVITDQRRRIESVVRSGGLRMTLGMVGMFALLFGLYWLAARVVGLEVSLAALLCAYTFRQLLTVFAVTPGGLGITEVGTAGLLVLLGGDAGAASATALLYAIYAHLLVVPVGVLALASWWFGPGGTALRTQAQEPSSLRT